MTRYFSWLFVAAFVLSFYVWQQTQSVRLGYRVESLEKECEKWDQENMNLRLRKHRLLSMDRLDQVAKARNLVTPDSKNTIYLER